MKKEFVRCPLCTDNQKAEDCALASVKRAEGEKDYIYCCESQAEKVKRK